MITPDVYNVVLGVGNPDARHFGYFDVRGHALRIASPGRETIEQLRTFFYPYIASHAETSSAESFHDLTVVDEPEVYDHLKANLPCSPDDLLTTALTHDLAYELRCFYSASRDLTIIEDEPLKLFYVVSDRGRTTKIIATNGSRTRTGLLRIIRGAWVLSQEALIVHGCALEKNGRGIIIAGEKHAGKTTSLLNLCSRKNYGIVANDRLLLKLNPADQTLRAFGVPTVVNLRRDTVRPFPKLRHLTCIPLFGVYDLAKALGVNVKPEVGITAIVFLSYDKDCHAPVFRSLSPEQSYVMLAPHLFSRREYEWVRMLQIGDGASAGIGGAVTNIPSSVACFQLSSNETQLEELAVLLDEWCQRGFDGAVARP